MEFYLGQIILGAWHWVPTGLLACDGATIQISDNEALYALLGTSFGGDGSTTFMLPKLTAPVASNAQYSDQINPGYYICATDGIWPSEP